MTRQQAFEKSATEGNKITHMYFTPEEWIQIDLRNRIHTEDGYIVSFEEFMHYRQTPDWEQDWSIYE